MPKFIEEIGGDIDFLVLDTAHSLPGEVLDFLLALPYLKKDAAVVLHDVTLSLIVDSPGSFATNVLLEAVSGDKYLLFSDDYPEGVDNIGGFVITKETSENIANVFFSLLKRWSYMPNEEQLKSYKRFYEKYYDDECLRLFSAAVSFNRKAEYRGKLKDCYEDPGELEIVLRHWAAAKDRVVIYGIGKYGEAFVRYAKVANLKADALVVTDGQNLRTISGSDLPVYELSKLPYLPEECMVIIAVQSQCTRKIIEKELRFRGYSMVL
ncbi:MAG: hypothetical protein IKN43_04120 [Selenomonadaceae bacterium]|nr:hypothetical protein [Selenomonadaceae bacterium]